MSHFDVVPDFCFHLPLPLKGFKMYKIESGLIPTLSYHRRDLYKLCLITAKSRVYYQTEVMEMDGSVLFFASPHAIYSWENISGGQSGYSCLFTEDFLSRYPLLRYLIHSPVVGVGDFALICLNQKQHERLASIFELLLSAHNTSYLFKQELIAEYIQCLIHEVLKMQSCENG